MIPTQTASNMFDNAAKKISSDIYQELQKAKPQILQSVIDLNPQNSPEQNIQQSHMILMQHLRTFKDLSL